MPTVISLHIDQLNKEVKFNLVDSLFKDFFEWANLFDWHCISKKIWTKASSEK